MLSFYKIVNNKLVFVARIKHEESAQRIVREWHDLGTDSTTLIAFTNPTPENTDGFVAHWTREPFALRLVA